MSQTVNPKAKEPEATEMTAMGAPLTNSATSVNGNHPEIHTKYHYTPLKSPFNFRTLEVEPGQRESDIHCSLHEGSPVFPHKIYCHDDTLFVTESLFTALRNYRRADQPVTMWVDAICINQEDMAERSQQVLLMQEIYLKSKQLWIWLGEASDYCSEAFQYVSDVLEIFGYPPGPDVENVAPVGDMIVATMNKITGESMIGLEQLFSNPWFRRAWTFQEVVCGPNAQISVGSLTLAFDLLSNWAILARCFIIPGGIFSSSTRLAMVQADVIRWCKTKRSKLYPMAITMRVRLATDPRDKIYSLIGIATDLDSLPFRPDYNIAVDTLYRDFAVHTITHSDDLDLLKFCNNIDPGPSKPSWVVDWRDRAFGTLDINTEESPFCASGYPTARACINDCKLSVNGLLVEKVAFIAKSHLRGHDKEPEDDEEPYRVDISMSCKTYEEAFQITHSRQWPNPEKVRSQALWRTLVGGRCVDNSRLLPDAEEDVREYFREIQRIDSDWENRAFAPEVDLRQITSIELRFTQMGTGRRFCMTESGRTGWVDESAVVGDLVSVLCGSAVPVLLRPYEDAFRVIGQCYIEGIMDGEAVEAANEPMRQIDLV